LPVGQCARKRLCPLTP